MPAARKRFIADLLQIHLEDLAFLGGQRREALHSRRHTLREFGEIGERIEAHVQGLLVAPPQHLVEWLTPQLAAPDRDDSFAAALALLRSGDAAAAQAVIVEFSRARGDTLAGLRDALSLATPSAHVSGELRSALEQAKPVTAAAAAVVLANHRQLDAASPRLAALLGEDDPSVCALAWRAAAAADTRTQEPPARPFTDGVSHAAPEVRRAAWHAAAWTGQAGAYKPLRTQAAAGDAVAIETLAVLGTPEDAPLLQKAALATEDPWARCDLLARFGHPPALNALVRWMDGSADADVPLAAAAGEAFTRITGLDVRGQRRSLPGAADADEFDREMAPEVWLPDAERARALLKQHAEHWAGGHRWCQGHRLDGELPRPLLLQLDLQARWEAAARAAMRGQLISAPAPIV